MNFNTPPFNNFTQQQPANDASSSVNNHFTLPSSVTNIFTQPPSVNSNFTMPTVNNSNFTPASFPALNGTMTSLPTHQPPIGQTPTNSNRPFGLDVLKSMNNDLNQETQNVQLNIRRSRQAVDRQSRIVENFYSQFVDRLKLPSVIAYLASEDLNMREQEILRNEPSQFNKINTLLDIIKRKHLLPRFYAALLQSGQSELAELLRNADPSLHDENIFGPSGASGDASSFDIRPPTAQAIAQNEFYYQAEIKSFPNVPETCGIIENLFVEAVDTPLKFPAFNSQTMYRNFSTPKGLALIINNKNFVTNGGLPDRLGTDIDRKNLENLLTQLGYSVKVKDNLTSHGMQEAMQKFARKDKHDKCDSALVVFLSHGENGALYGTDCLKVPVEILVSALNSQNCPKLTGKPKIFIIQACRGEKYDLGIDSTDTFAETEKCNRSSAHVSAANKLADRVAEMDVADARAMSKTPTEADVLIAYATTPGYVSWRNSLHGSWFVQAICQVFSKFAKNEELLSLLTEVNRIVAEKVSTSNHVQVPEPCTRLRKKFFFFPGVKYDSSNYL